MKSILKVLFFAVLMTATLSPVHAKEPQAPVDNSSPELKRIKALAGRWSSTTSMFGTPNETLYTEYQVTAAGSAVLERSFVGTPHEMISVYYDDNGKLAMTHYCIMQNRPYLKLVSSDKKSMTLDVTKVEGLKSEEEPSMGAITLAFKDQDHFSSTCKSRGKEQHEPMMMEFTRVK